MPMMTANSGTGRWVGLGMVAALHVGFFAAISSGLDIRVVRKLVEDLHVIDVVPEIREPPKHLDAPIDYKGPMSELPPMPLPPPDLTLPEEATGDGTPTLVGDGGDDAGSGPVLPEEPLVRSSVDPRHPLTQPEYPPRARLLNEQGRVRLKLHVMASGRIDSVVVLSSSGYQRLDDAAIQHALKHWAMVPASKGGNAIDSWIEVPVVFRLTSQ